MGKLEKYFVPYEESMELKRLGFNEECLFTYSSNTKELGVTLPTSANNLSINIQDFNTLYPGVELCSAPLFSQAFNFILSKYKIYSDMESLEFWFKYVEETFLLEKELGYNNAELKYLRNLLEIIKNE